MNSRAFFAHTAPDSDDASHWQPLEKHLSGVARRARVMAAAFSSAEVGYCAGLWHDVGKYRPEFQKYLFQCAEARRLGLQEPGHGPEHSGAGAALAQEKIPGKQPPGAPLHPVVLVIAGHHAGLADNSGNAPGTPAPVRTRLPEAEQTLSRIRPHLPPRITSTPLPPPPAFLLPKTMPLSNAERAVLLRRREFWTRFLLSVLVDADRLDTEHFHDREKARLRRKRFDPIRELRRRLDEWIDTKVAALPAAEKKSPVNRHRQEILERCRQAALEPPGVFSLTVPTGGGKTLSSMSFALRHAERHGLRRVIVVIPYTSIIEQNAAEYRRALGPDNVLEHHNNLDVERRRRTLGDEPADRHDLATENWRMPVIVTTTVQFFETLFTNRTSRVRKLHNVARSVIILDEVQTLPPGQLLPILEALRELTAHYGCSVLLSTATPPALAQRPTLPDGLESIRPIIPDPQSLARTLARVRFEGLDTIARVRTWQELAPEIAGLAQVLVIVHRRDDARTL